MRQSLNFNNKRSIPAEEARIPGSTERIVGNNGEINASDRKDLLGQMIALATMIEEKEVLAASVQTPASKREQAKKNREVLVAAYNDTAGHKWAELGAALSGEVSELADREGLMRKVYKRVEVQDNQPARIRVHKKNVRAITADGPSQLYATFLRDDYFMPPEFYVKANIRVEERELNMGAGDLLEDKFFEATEQIAIEEDKVMKRQLDSAAGKMNSIQLLANGFNLTALTSMAEQIERWGLGVDKAMFSVDFLQDIRANPELLNAYSEVSKLELIQSGKLGVLHGITLISDAYRAPELKVFNRGEIYFVGQPEYLATYTDRGPVRSKEVDSNNEGVPARGWFFWEELSMTLFNYRAVVKGRKI